MKDVEFYAFRVPSEIKGRRPYLTRWKMTIKEGKARFPDGVPELNTLEVRRLPSTPEEAYEHGRSISPSHKPVTSEALQDYGQRLKQWQDDERAATADRPERA